jgi:hypothetical protein
MQKERTYKTKRGAEYKLIQVKEPTRRKKKAKTAAKSTEKPARAVAKKAKTKRKVLGVKRTAKGMGGVKRARRSSRRRGPRQIGLFRGVLS